MTRRDAGFSLLEVLVALAVLGMLMLMLAEGVRVGFRGLSTYGRLAAAETDMEPVAHALRRMLQRMAPGVYPVPPDVRGSATALAFTTELPDPATGRILTADVRLATDHGRLVLWWTPHPTGVPLQRPPPPRAKVLLDHVDKLEISYVARDAPETWISNWSKPALPAVVRLVIIPSDTGKYWPPIIVRPLAEQADG